MTLDSPRPARRKRSKPNDIDAFVGQRIRERRQIAGVSQEKLAEALGLTFQQIQKYERGANRVGAGRLYALSQALNVPVDHFFEGAPLPSKVRRMPETFAVTASNPMGATETRALVRSYYKMRDIKTRQAFLSVMRELAGDGSELSMETDEDSR